MPVAFCVVLGVLVSRVVSLSVSESSIVSGDTPAWFPVTENLLNLATTDNALSDIRKPSSGEHRLVNCGFSFDCPLDYSIADINETAMRYHMPNRAEADKLHSIHEQARAACTSMHTINEHGGWCYSHKKVRRVRAGTNSDTEYLLPAYHVEADRGFVAALAKHVLPQKNGSCCESLTDLGAGVGQFGHALKANHPAMDYHGYDGAGNVEEFTSHYVRFIDLTQHLYLPRTSYVISSEVGEHIPHKYEQQMIANIHNHNCKGVILTWGILNQGGHGHINNHSNEYLIKVFQELGYAFNGEKTEELRRSASSSPWLQRSTLVFERMSRPAECNDV